MYTKTQFCLPASSLKSKQLIEQNAKKHVEFYQDVFISEHEKEQQAKQYLEYLVSKIEINNEQGADKQTLDWINDTTQIEQHCYAHLKHT